MILSISGISRSNIRGLVLRIFGTLFCIVFAVVYNQFGHGVTSPYMNFMFLYPLVLGVGGYLILMRVHRTECFFTPWSKWYHWGIVTLVFGNALKGIFDIAGTSSPYVVLYWIVGGMLIFIGTIGILLSRTQGAKEN